MSLCHLISSSSNMDYLTILATRSLVLFDTTLPSAPGSSASSPMSSPAASIASLTPPPVTLSLLSLMRDETHCAHFLSNHVLEASGGARDSHAVAHDAAHRSLLQEAEVLAWQQICRAKTFAQELGHHYSRGALDEEQLGELAATHGFRLAPAPEAVPTRRRDRSEVRKFELP